jgi:hypothetical protein
MQQQKEDGHKHQSAGKINFKKEIDEHMRTINFIIQELEDSLMVFRLWVVWDGLDGCIQSFS